MPAIPQLTALTGAWQGTNQLWLAPGQPVHESQTRAAIETVAHSQFNEVRYTWSYEGQPQEGRILIGQASAGAPVKAVWFDTWHMQDQFMVCEGALAADGTVLVKGSYPAPSGPDWGWQIGIAEKGQDAFELVMYNITPQGEAFLAVQATLARHG